MKNLHTIDTYIRVGLGSLAIISAISLHSYLFLLPAIFLIYTASKGYCIVYNILGINKGLAQYNELIVQLPTYNPSPVFIFDQHGKRVFRNKPAIESMGQIIQLKELWLNENGCTEDFIEKEEKYSEVYKTNGKHILVTLIGIQKTRVVVAYTQDISDIIKADQEIIQTQKEIVYTMGEIGETRSKETGHHVKRVAEYSALLAKKIGLDSEEAELIKMASPMHDIGKVGIPDRILNKPGKLNDEEWTIMKTHAQLGYEMLKHSDRAILKASAIIAKEHHEKYDGSGYPLGIKGSDIHIYARITAVADVFDALGSDRVYKKSWDLDQILTLFKEESGRHFDPVLTDILFDNLSEFLAIRDEYQDAS